MVNDCPPLAKATAPQAPPACSCRAGFRIALRGLCVVMLCSASAAAETLEEAVARLGKAAAGTRDLTVKFSVQEARYRRPEGGGKAVKSLSMAGTGEFQMLRDGQKCLMRLAASITEERPSKDPSAGPEKPEQRVLAVNDGRFVWHEEGRAGRDKVSVSKEQGDPDGGLGLSGGSISLLDGVYKTTGIKGTLDKAGKEADIKLAGKGTVAGRATTIIELTIKPEVLKDKSDVWRELRPTRSVIQFDDATGAAVSGQDINAAGDVLTDFKATEVKANSGLDKKLFTYTPPEGAKVRDRTQPATSPSPAKEPAKAPAPTPEEKAP